MAALVRAAALALIVLTCSDFVIAMDPGVGTTPKTARGPEASLHHYVVRRVLRPTLRTNVVVSVSHQTPAPHVTMSASSALTNVEIIARRVVAAKRLRRQYSDLERTS